MNEEMILRAVPYFGTEGAPRYGIQNITSGEYWNGNFFSYDTTNVRLYAHAGEACAEMASILRETYGHMPRSRYFAPVEIELYGNASINQIARYLHRASVLNIRTHEYGNGPQGNLVLPTIHWGLLRGIEDTPMLSKLECYEEIDWGMSEDIFLDDESDHEVDE